MLKLIYRGITLIFSVLLSINVNAQAFKVTGTITDENNNPLPFVTVIEKGSQNGTVSSEDGNYSINVSEPNSTLVFSYVGYLTEKIQVDGRNVIDIQLIPDLTSLDEVIVVGYGTQKKSDLTGAIASVSSEDLENANSSSIDQALQGKAAGVQIVSNSGAPGSSMSVRIRGMGSINAGTQPLYVVDGFIMSDQSFGKEGSTSPDNKVGIGFLDPSEIESIEILKDASAAAIYGARGANGVVLITTKKGKSGEGKLNFNAYVGKQYAPEERYWDVMTGTQYRDYLIDYYKERFDENWLWVATNPESPSTILRFINENEEPQPVDNFNWQDAIFNPADIQNYKLSASGGNDKSTYLISGSYYQQDGLMGNSGIDRISLRMNGDHQLKDFIKVGGNITGSKYNRDRVNEGGFGGGSILGGALYADPTLTPKTSEGNWTTFDETTTGAKNPVYTMQRDLYNYENYKLLTTGYFDIQFIPSLVFRSLAGIEISDGTMEAFYPSYRLSPTDGRDNNEFYHREERWINWDWENTLTFSKSFGVHDLTLLGGFTMQKETFTDWRSYIVPFPYDEPFMRYPTVSDNTTIKEFDSDPMEYAIQSYLGRATYSYKDKILLTSSFRRDGSSKFGPNNRWGNFPSFSVGYKLSEEDFIQRIEFINFMKIRLGWGLLGNQAIAPYQFYVPVDATTPIAPLGIDKEIFQGAFPYGLANEDVKWETTAQTNFGLDIGMLENKITLTIDGFRKRTSDMLIPVPLPEFMRPPNLNAATGGSPPLYANIAEMENNGFEALISYKTINLGRGLSFKFTANISKVNNEIISLGTGLPIPSNHQSLVGGNLSKTVEGESIGGFFGYRVEGIYQDSTEILNSPYQVNVEPGDYRFADTDGNDTITTDDRTFIGSPLPDFSYGFNFTLGYKGFDLYCQFNGTHGNDIVNIARYRLFGDDPTNKHADYTDRWTSQNKNAEIHRLGNTTHNLKFSSFYIEDGSFLRVTNLTLGYDFPENWVSTLKMSNLRMYVTVQNLYTFTKYSGMEPEVGKSVSWSASPLDIGVDQLTYPQPRTFMLGLNLSF